jgi:hypothetical protein
MIKDELGVEVRPTKIEDGSGYKSQRLYVPFKTHQQQIAELEAENKRLREAGELLRNHVAYARAKAAVGEFSTRPSNFDQALADWDSIVRPARVTGGEA